MDFNQVSTKRTDFNQVSTKRTGVWSASFQYQAWYYTVLETELFLHFRVYSQHEYISINIIEVSRG